MPRSGHRLLPELLLPDLDVATYGGPGGTCVEAEACALLFTLREIADDRKQS